MNDLLTESFEINRNQSSRSGDIELGNAAHSGELALEGFFKKVQEIDKQYDKLSVLLRKLQDAQEESKSVTKAGAMKAIKQRMQKDVDEVQKIARAIKSKIEELGKDNFASRQKPGCGKGTAVDRSRSSTTLALKKKFKDKMGKFQTLRENIRQEYREVVERRVYTVTGKHADEETIDQLIETGDSEQIFQKAIQEQGRGQIMDTVSEIHERHDAVREVERKLLELQQIFMDMAALVDAQGDMLDNIESQKHRKLERNKSREDDKDFGGNSAQPMVTSETSDVTCVSNRSYRIKDNVEYELKPSSKSLKKNAKEVMTKKTKFEEYLDMENEVPTAEEDLEMERRLAKKLKVKNGKLSGDDDELNFLLGGSDKEYGSLNNDTNIIDIIENKGKKKKKKRETLEQDMEVSGDDKLREDRGTELSEADLIHLKTGIETEDVKKKEKKVKGKRKKTKFEEYLAIENTGTSTTEEDLKLERRLAKKLKVKDGKLPGDDDGISFLFGDSEQEYAPQNDGSEIIKTTKTKNKKTKKKKKGETSEKDVQVVSGDGTSDKIIHENDNPSRSIEDHVAKANAEAPRSNTYVAPHMRASSSTDPNGNLLVRRRIRGLLNRLTESNMESITREVFALFESTGRSVASQIVAEEVLASCAGGPRGNEQYAAAFAAFVSGLTCMVGIDFGAKLLVFLAKSFEEEYLKKDNLSLRNLTLLLSYLYTFGVCSSDLIYDFLVMLSKQMTEIDVSTILTILQCCGMKLRSDDPAAMKEFIHGVQNRVTELKASSGDENTKASGRRMQFMLETICDIKNNKKRKEELPQHTRVKKWLQKLRVDDVSIHGVKWSKLLDPEKKGQWWLTGDLASADNVEEVAITIDKEVLEAQKMLELAASQRMNTDVRKAIFCVIMSGEDYLDAFEKLIRLDLQGKQDREIMRVLLECCLQEKVFNKYYAALAIKLCHHEKNHKFTLQYCLWDQFKELDSMPLLRSMHLAKFLAEMLASFTLSLAVLKAVDLSDIVQLSPKRIMHFRMLFDTVFAHPDNVVWNVFTRIAVTPELEALRVGMEFFIMEHVLPSNVNVKKKFKLAKKSLSNTEGNAELFTLTYGAIVRQLLTDLEEVVEVNKQLDIMGYSIGVRLIDEFLAKSNISRCVDFKETAEVIAKVGFKMFLGVNASVTNWDVEGTTCSIVLEDNPLVDFVELPETCQGLHYCNILSGVIRGALEMVSMKTEVTWIRDMLRGDDACEMQVKLLKQVPEECPYKDDD